MVGAVVTRLGVSIAQAAEETSLSDKVIRDAGNNQKLPARKVGARIVILHADLEAWLHSQPMVGEAS